MPRLAALCLALCLAAPAAGAGMIDDFTDTRAGDWRFFTDQVMGGVSTGAARLETSGDRRALHLTGTVSTENRGGFIQARKDLPDGLPAGTEAITLTARGNDTRYFLHIRTRGTVLPWQYYQAPFEVTGDWRDITVPLSAFERSGRLLGAEVTPESIRSIAVVAYGRDHAADLWVARIGTR